MGAVHYQHQLDMGREYVIPFLKREMALSSDMNILEVGCAESGLIKSLDDERIHCDGLELIQGRIDKALEENPDFSIYQGDITNQSLINELNGPYDLIIIRDVIEHIPERDKAMQVMSSLLKPKGYLYITFPPYFSPYAGHQQNSKGALRYFLWIHLLPHGIINWLGKITSEKEKLIEDIKINSKIGLTISHFEKLSRNTNFDKKRLDLFSSRPIYKIRWNWPIIRFPNIPILREVFATGCEYLLQKK